ncbi:hypothetical protein H8959_011638, partial [Pygathrix nigripes]
MCCSSGTRKIRTHKTTCGRNRCFEIPEEVVDDEEFDWEIEQTPMKREKDVESAWNIRKLSPTLCWLETWTNVHDIMVSFGRRMLCYPPLYRHFKLAMKACGETIKILQLGKSAVLKCLLDMHKIFQENDPAYILNDLYISDYCVWIQKVKTLAALAEALKEVSLTKAQLGLELEELEAAALLVQEEESALKAAHSVSGQQKLFSSSEASDSEDSDGTVTSGNEDSDSDSEQDELKDSPSETVSSLQGPFLEESGALLNVDGGICTNTAIQESDTSQGKLLASWSVWASDRGAWGTTEDHSS